MNKYTVKLNTPFDEIIETRFKDADIFITYKPQLNDYLLFVETNQNMERIISFDWVEKVSKVRQFSLNI